jgi:dihydrofolate reductase
MSRKLILFIAASVDGYIAGPNDDLSFLSIVEHEGEDYGYADFTKNIDTVILGKRTYDKVMSMGIPFPYADKETFIITRTPEQTQGLINFYTGDLKLLVHDLKQKEGKNIFCDGGAYVVNILLQHGLIDEVILSIIPVLLGDGTRLFKNGFNMQRLNLIRLNNYPKGLIQMHYKLLK